MTVYGSRGGLCASRHFFSPRREKIHSFLSSAAIIALYVFQDESQVAPGEESPERSPDTKRMNLLMTLERKRFFISA